LTLGQVHNKLIADTTKYNAFEVGYALIQDIAEELMKCALRHEPIFDEDEYCVGFVLAADPIFKETMMRRKFFAYLYLPSPRPNQCIFLYNKKKQQFIKRLWTLPNAATMAELSEMSIVDRRYRDMKGWCDAFFKLKFWEYIREQHKIDMLSESEYLKVNREKLIKSGCQDGKPSDPEPFNFGKIAGHEIIHPLTPVLN
jgi:hypothetical protein